MAQKCKREIVRFDDMGIFRLIMSVEDKQLLKEISEELLSPLIERDKDRNSNYIETLDSYLRNDGSIQAVSAEMFTHRNTVIYRIKNIKIYFYKNKGSNVPKIKTSYDHLLFCGNIHLLLL